MWLYKICDILKTREIYILYIGDINIVNEYR